MAISIHFEKIPDNSTKTRNIPSNYVIQSRKSFQSNPKDVVSCTPVLLSHSHPFFCYSRSEQFTTLGRRSKICDNRPESAQSVPRYSLRPGTWQQTIFGSLQAIAFFKVYDPKPFLPSYCPVRTGQGWASFLLFSTN